MIMINRPGRRLLRRPALVCALACTALLFTAPASAQGPQLKLNQLDPLAGRAKETVDVALDPATLQMAGGFLSGRKEAAAEKGGLPDLVAGLKAVYVRSYSFEEAGAYSEKDVESVRSQLTAPWTKLVSVRSQKDGESVDVYMWPENGQSGGMAVLVADPKELTVVNIIGRIDLAQLAAMGGKFGIPKGVGVPKPAQPPVTPDIKR